MQTEELINALKADSARQSMSLGRTWRVALACAALAAAVVFYILLGPRPDFATAAHTVRFMFKFVVMLMLASAAFGLLRALSRPGSNIALPALRLIAAPAVLGVAVAVELVVVPSDQWRAIWWGTNISVCLTFIPVIGIAPLAVFLLALRHGAPTRPAVAGAVAGLLAGGLSATFYAAHCTDDSPLFVATWYSIAIASLAFLGMILGPRIARW
ncbi:NrsF family protein [Mycoplana rhizolycopersici]|uniref:DUF1109 family protein n=1 Tax=Mycoplana rhizolycopersici TaxID=2746702 RepID=A0ABX2QK07_9HYPH|nr:NrsF family protein [Rhizobium rhizolycopersici]NVP57686.1 DUF1109 family protein [Rhizobium rhizolycopersici]